MTLNVKDQLVNIIKRRSFSTGKEMKLASGRSSNFYFNMKPTMMDPEGAWLISELILGAIEGMGVDYVGGLEMGAVPIASSVAAVSFERENPVAAFFIRKKTKEHGTQKLIEGLTDEESLDGKTVVIVEDVTTTGGSSLLAVEAVRKEGAKVACVLTIVDREEGAFETFHSAGVPFTALLTAADFK
ncbi:MAG: orotate phosphoribosyltransferase [Hyphomicrobiaceae bacterium]|nr:orotate phosphoribosyltransferase [Hyphomicrobiaceae bacterium]